MSYEGPELHRWFGTSAVDKLCHDLAAAGGERQTELVKRNTPINDDPFATSRGGLRASFFQLPVTRGHDELGDRVYESGVATEDDIAPLIENGWGLWGPHHAKYVIRPRRPGGWLHWHDRATGEDRFAREVHHPGAPGQHMIAIGTAKAEHEFDSYATDHLLRWAERQEKLIGRRFSTAGG